MLRRRAQSCKQVVGVEIIPQAIKDADFNATANGISNCKFYAGNCDDYIRKFVYENRDDDLLAIIDPPRAGLREYNRGGMYFDLEQLVFISFLSNTSIDVKSIASLRNSKGLNRFVYISCSPKAALRNWLDLARPSSKQYKGNPFVVTAAVGVDMFPHTHHKEMVLLFERTVDEVVDERGKQEVGVDVKTDLVAEEGAAPIIAPSAEETDTEMVAEEERQQEEVIVLAEATSAME